LTIAVADGTALGAVIQGTVKDTNGQALPGVTIEVTAQAEHAVVTVTDQKGHYTATVSDGAHQINFRLINFAAHRR